MTSEDLRREMVARIADYHEAKGLTMRPEIWDAMRTVPRELFAPREPLERVYRHDLALVTKRDESGRAVSSMSAAWLQAEMLNQALTAHGTLRGCRVLEIGTGSGCNAALLRNLVGPSGRVTSVDIDDEVADRAAKHLRAAGYHDVRVACQDGAQTIDPGKYQLIMVTAGAWDVPEAWFRQLGEGAVLVAPLRTWGMTRSWALRMMGAALFSESQVQCGFVDFRGDAARKARDTEIADGVHVVQDEDEASGWGAAGPLLKEKRVEEWCGLILPPRTMLGNLDLYLAARLQETPGEFGLLMAEDKAIPGTVDPSWPAGTPAVLSKGTIAYRSRLKWTGGEADRKFDLGAYAHGAGALGEASRLRRLMREWVEAGQPAPRLRIYPAGDPGKPRPDGTVLEKRDSRFVLDFAGRGGRG